MSLIAPPQAFAPPAPLAPSARDDEAPASRARIEHLFRLSLRRGQINPLMHILLRHRSEPQEQEHGSGN